MGARCIRRWLEEPLKDIDAIKNRQNIIGLLFKASVLRKNIRKILRSMGDLERLSGRAGAQQAGARDLVAIADGINRLPLIKKYTSEKYNEYAKKHHEIIARFGRFPHRNVILGRKSTNDDLLFLKQPGASF